MITTPRSITGLSLSRVCSGLQVFKLKRTNSDIRDAVRQWLRNPAAAEARYGHISQWDTSDVTDMQSLFRGCNNFNEDISAWQVGNVRTMRWMFLACANFNQDLSKWDVSSVTDLHCCFLAAKSFNADISTWDVSACKDMNGMFAGATGFKRNIRRWKLPYSCRRKDMFQGTSIPPNFQPEHKGCPEASIATICTIM
jgi:surface protein